MIDSQWFSLSPTPFVIVFGIVIVAACAVLGWMAIKRSEFKRSIMWLEGLRLLMVALVALAILQPEWLQKFLPEEDPVIAVLWDQSHSMDTEDVLPDQGDGILPDGTKATSRKDSIAELISDATWESFREKMNVVVEPFSSTLANPQEGSDINAVLTMAMEKHANLRAVVLASDGSWNVGPSPTCLLYTSPSPRDRG